ncbi:hypothetical protein Nepgr_011478 [Nepenthes gracilis]|uniref:DM2 domain-containing protein n=1 Tax=Nepenthes gracilis TaxID=150966 RepID=A0AAD3SEE6_NEPGR|nr:hypothetical protein Nepgr_011478 [Nepenthes gracilis]
MTTSSSWRGLGGKCRVLMAAVRASSGAASTTNISSKAAAARSTISKPPKAASRSSRGIAKAVPVSTQLGEFLGVQEVSRTDAVKKVWEYIKLRNLQSPADKKVIRCDDKLKTIFDGKDTVGFLEIAKLLSRHFVKAA